MVVMAMHPQAALLLTLILLLLATGDGSLAVGTPSAIIRTTCATVDRAGGEVGYDTCVGLLSADPAAAAAKDARQLAVVATNLTVANVTSTVLVLKDLVKNLGDCLRYYRDMNKTLEAALGDLRAGRVQAASDKLLDASHLPDDCDILLFQGSAGKNPMSKENTDADLLSRLAYAITDLQLPNPPRHRR
ncbi:unnamed protein product [Triticum turgidum subsp. durum]|uniref:Pectinesterase inhibitor domain-containing protein n=1 Tax=Triticum turgidum subsp. durum TaxID=4567 RepID=A0A9R0XM03_TRITD|nr:unnamed protein product [Triticum turgidum subsp. durum]